MTTDEFLNLIKNCPNTPENIELVKKIFEKAVNNKDKKPIDDQLRERYARGKKFGLAMKVRYDDPEFPNYRNRTFIQNESR